MPAPYYSPLAPDDVPAQPEDYDPNDFHWSELGYLDQKYMWMAWGDNCVICNAMHGKCYTLDFWINAGIWPGFHANCDCSMRKVPPETPTSDPDFFGVNVPEYANFWLPGPNLLWDPDFMIQPWQMSLVTQIEQMHLAPDDVPAQPEDYDPNDFHWSELGYLDQKYMWMAWGDNCVICNAMHGKCYTLDFWINAGIWPGFHANCDCSMRKVPPETPTSDPDFFGVNVPEYANFWLPGPNLLWDPDFMIQPWQMSLVTQIEQMHLAAGSDTPFSELFKQLKGNTFFSHRTGFVGDTVGWRILATQRHFENIDGQMTGSTLLNIGNVGYILEPLWRWFEQNWKTSTTFDPNRKYAQLKRSDTPIVLLRPYSLKPLQPYQSYSTEVE